MAAVEFTGRGASLACMHQYGGEDRVAGGPRVRYATWELLGYAEGDSRLLRDLLLRH